MRDEYERLLDRSKKGEEQRWSMSGVVIVDCKYKNFTFWLPRQLYVVDPENVSQ